MEFNLKKILKSLLFSTSEPLSIKDIQAVITRFHQEADRWRKEAEEAGELMGEGNEQSLMNDLIDQVPALLTATQIRDAMDEIQRDFNEANEVIRLVQGPRGYQITCAPDYADWVRLLRGEPRPTRLSRAALETLAIVAYRQPVTRAEMENIRGVSVDGAISRLLEHDLVAVVGRADLPGRPLQYGTTEKFLEFCGIKSTDELPSSDVLSPNQINDWLTNKDSQDLSDADMGLAEEPEDSEAPREDDDFDAEDAEDSDDTEEADATDEEVESEDSSDETEKPNA